MAEGDNEEFDANWAPGQPIEGVLPQEPIEIPDSFLIEEPVPVEDALSAEEAEGIHIPTPEEAALLNGSDPADPTVKEPIVTEAAFLVWLDESGHWCGDTSAVNRPVVVVREANMNDYRHAIADMGSDLLAHETAQRSANATLQLQQQVMMQAVQAKQTQDIAQATGLAGGGVDLATLQKMAAKGGQGGPIMPGR